MAEFLEKPNSNVLEDMKNKWQIQILVFNKFDCN